ncbi:OsmC family protein [Aegicerativicinus sediminis]|uniref:OsmC family protein n=1 Tax=Aegicerativicinus sediminis TaxID=2893202 RepID=UPI001E5F8458|nr:OsmC family protein [Aegicerativicinus sediminis]
MKRNASAHWEGNGKNGKGHLTTQSSVLDKTQYSFTSRFEQGIGTNPEELIAAAHAGCFTMKLAFILQEAGYTADSLDTTCEVSLEDGSIKTSKLHVTGSIPNLDEETFKGMVKDAEENCPISQSLTATTTASYTLN